MTTLASDAVKWMAAQWEDHCGYPSAVLSGIVPDRAHLGSGGYHCSIQDLRAHGNGNDYSAVRPDDKGFNPAYGAAVDMSMNPTDMVRCHHRVRAVWADRSDPRRQYINAINVWDGSGDAVRLDFYGNAAGFADDSHTWHSHGEFRRRWVLDPKAALAIVSVLRGDTKQQWLGQLQEGTTMADDYGRYGRPAHGVGDRTAAVMQADLWWQELAGVSPYDNKTPSRRSAQLNQLVAAIAALQTDVAVVKAAAAAAELRDKEILAALAAARAAR